MDNLTKKTETPIRPFEIKYRFNNNKVSRSVRSEWGNNQEVTTVQTTCDSSFSTSQEEHSKNIPESAIYIKVPEEELEEVKNVNDEEDGSDEYFEEVKDEEAVLMQAKQKLKEIEEREIQKSMIKMQTRTPEQEVIIQKTVSAVVHTPSEQRLLANRYSYRPKRKISYAESDIEDIHKYETDEDKENIEKKGEQIKKPKPTITQIETIKKG